jgi:hypothetical protein
MVHIGGSHRKLRRRQQRRGTGSEEPRLAKHGDILIAKRDLHRLNVNQFPLHPKAGRE